MSYKFLRIVLFNFFLIHQCFSSHICIDVDEFNFTQEGKKGLRVSVFDAKNQRYNSINYYNYHSNTESRIPTGEIGFNSYGIKIYYDGTIETTQEFNRSNCILRTTKEKIICQNEVIPGESILETLNNFDGRSQKPSFKVCFHSTDGEIKKDFSSLCSTDVDRNAERGRIGELATELTMISFGYYKLPSQNNSNQGFDGVFTDNSSNPELFLTESKCREQSKAAKTVIKQELSEQAIHKKIIKMGTSDETRKVIEKFINTHPQKIFKFSHRIKKNGECQCCVEQFKDDIYFNSAFSNISLQSSQSDKMLILKTVSDKMFTNPEDFLKTYFCLLKTEKKLFNYKKIKDIFSKIEEYDQQNTISELEESKEEEQSL